MKNKLISVSVLSLITLFGASCDNTEALLNIFIDIGPYGNRSWEKVELPGTKCGNGSQYKFFIRQRTSSKNVLIYFEGGGACWDHASCTGRTGIRGARNPNGVPDDYMSHIDPKYTAPLVNGADPGLPFRSRTDLVTSGWNVVFMPYCTGDVHIGNNVVTYNDPDGTRPPLNWHHAGYPNTLAVLEHVKTQFPSINKMMVSGYSAGGTATSAAYYHVRRILNPKKGYMLNDSGPVYIAPKNTAARKVREKRSRRYWSWRWPWGWRTKTYWVTKTIPGTSSKSRPLHEKITQSWSLSTLFAELPDSFDQDDFGSINQMASVEFPGDQLGYTAYTRDGNYSGYSYERFYPDMTKDKIHAYWKEDQDILVDKLNGLKNFSYFIPHHRALNDSHCTTIITFIGAHACARMDKRKWYERLYPPGWWQPYICRSEMTGMSTFLKRFVNEDKRVRVVEPTNWYNNSDIGMKLITEIVEQAMK